VLGRRCACRIASASVVRGHLWEHELEGEPTMRIHQGRWAPLSARTQYAPALLAAVMLLLAGACTSDESSPNEPRRERVLAPIESVEVIVAESFPPQYFVQVTSGLANGCAQFDEVTTERDGDTVRITVWNTMPVSDEAIACTMIYGFVENNVALGTDFAPNQRYSVEVNDVTESFVAQ
jgi:hypothetical protein